MRLEALLQGVAYKVTDVETKRSACRDDKQQAQSGVATRQKGNGQVRGPQMQCGFRGHADLQGSLGHSERIKKQKRTKTWQATAAKHTKEKTTTQNPHKKTTT